MLNVPNVELTRVNIALLTCPYIRFYAVRFLSYSSYTRHGTTANVENIVNNLRHFMTCIFICVMVHGQLRPQTTRKII